MYVHNNKLYLQFVVSTNARGSKFLSPYCLIFIGVNSLNKKILSKKNILQINAID